MCFIRKDTEPRRKEVLMHFTHIPCSVFLLTDCHLLPLREISCLFWQLKSRDRILSLFLYWSTYNQMHKFYFFLTQLSSSIDLWYPSWNTRDSSPGDHQLHGNYIIGVLYEKIGNIFKSFRYQICVKYDTRQLQRVSPVLEKLPSQWVHGQTDNKAVWGWIIDLAGHILQMVSKPQGLELRV